MGDTTPTSRPALSWGVATDAGRVREGNEDSFVAEPMVLGIADGMGGHQAGEVASQLAVDILRERLSGGARNEDVVEAAVLEANVSIFQSAHANASQRGMGTTLTAIALLRDEDDDQYGSDAHELVLVNVGDSRAYVNRNGLLRRASIDHSYVQELVATGHITEAEARTHPRRNIVTRALGIEPVVRVDTWRLPLVRGDRYILCSDGLVDEADDGEIEALVNRIDDPQDAADELVALANHHGGRDNVTVIVVDVLVGAEPPAGPAAEPTYDADDLDEVETDPSAETGEGVAAGSTDDATRGEHGDATGNGDDHTAAMPRITTITTTPTGPDTTSRPKKRKMTLGMFLFLLALAAIITVTVVLLAVAVGNDDDDAPNPSVPATSVTSTSVATTSAPATSTTSPTSTSNSTVAVSTTAVTTSTASVTASSAG